MPLSGKITATIIPRVYENYYTTKKSPGGVLALIIM
jgi:hypothetical protein